ncbi:hypothetical protein CEQ90_06550 [Lewinellaceae bacterium SD302]|nr:hypothetical protein CEQ90_06550 [Lewinellaceae bacterium SD302]
MATILICTTGLFGILNASLEVARRLEADGHDVQMAAPRDRKAIVEKAGYQFHCLPEINTTPTPPVKVKGGKWTQWQERIVKAGQRRQFALESTRPTAFIDLMDQLRPDLCLIDVELHEYTFAAHGRHQPYLLLSQWYSLWDRPGLPYQLDAAMPGDGFGGSIFGMRLNWLKVKAKRKLIFTRQRLLSLRTDRRSTLLALADEYGFPRSWIAKNFWPGPFTYTGPRVLAMAPLELEFPHEPPPWLTYVGPMVRTDRPEQAASSLNKYTYANILEVKNRNAAKLIICTVSTLSAGAEHFLIKLCRAVADRPDWMLVVATGGKVAIDQLPVAKNVFPFDFLPQLKYLQVADLSINHGGIHTIHECIEFGVPMLVYSGKRSDQPGCAARVHYHGLGMMADKDVDTSAEIAQKIEMLLTEDAFQQKVIDTKRKTDLYRKNKVLENIISKKLDQSRPAKTGSKISDDA